MKNETPPSKFQSKVLWNAITAFCIVVIGTIVVGSIWLSGEVLAYLQPVLVPLAVAGIFAYLLNPIVNWLQRRKLSRMKSIILVFVISLIGITIFATRIIGPFSQQVQKLNKETPRYFKQTKEMLGDFGAFKLNIDLFNKGEKVDVEATKLETDAKEAPLENEIEVALAVPETNEEQTEETENSSASDSTWLSLFQDYKLLDTLEENGPELLKKGLEIITRGASKVFGWLGYALGFLMVPIYLFFFLKESDKIKNNWEKFIPLKASKFKDELVDTLEEINDYLIAFFRGQVLVSLIDGVLIAIALSLFGHPYAILLGISLGVLGIIPFIGNIIVLIPAVVTSFAYYSVVDNQSFLGTNPWIYVFAVVFIFLMVQNINSLVTAPKIVGDSVGLHPMTVIFSMLFWSLLLGGFLGALLAVPLTASLKVIFKRYIWERSLACQIGNPEGKSDQEEVTS